MEHPFLVCSACHTGQEPPNGGWFPGLHLSLSLSFPPFLPPLPSFFPSSHPSCGTKDRTQGSCMLGTHSTTERHLQPLPPSDYMGSPHQTSSACTGSLLRTLMKREKQQVWSVLLFRNGTPQSSWILLLGYIYSQVILNTTGKRPRCHTNAISISPLGDSQMIPNLVG